jgi:hypothetical protein
MKKSLTQVQENDLIFIREWCNVIIDFISALHNDGAEFLEIYKQSFSNETKEKYLKEFKPSVFMRGVKQAFYDTNEWASELRSADVKELNTILKSRFGKDLNFYSKERYKKINQIIKKGRISNDEEFRMIDERANEICQSEEKKSELEKLNQLLLMYETK